MTALGDWWDDLWNDIQHSPAILPLHHQIAATQVDVPGGEEFKQESHYFVVKVNRAYLQYGREYWTTHAPMALVVSEFKYDGETTVVPFVVGPSLLEKGQIEVPASFLFSDTKVAGIHPYKGGGLTLTVILYSVVRTNLAEKLMKLVESLASVIDLSQSLASYLKIANLMVRTVNDLISGGSQKPLIGLRKEFDGDAGFGPGHFALIDSRNIRVDQNKLWVRNSGLYIGDRPDALTEFTGANYVLYSINQRKGRDDFEQLAPIHDLWKKVKTEATRTTVDDWDNTKGLLSTLYQEMVTSPNLTLDHANEIAEYFEKRMVSIHDRALENVRHGVEELGPDPLARVRQRARSIRNL